CRFRRTWRAAPGEPRRLMRKAFHKLWPPTLRKRRSKDAFGCGYFKRRLTACEMSGLARSDPCWHRTRWRDMRISAVLRLVAAYGLRQFGAILQDSLRQPF